MRELILSWGGVCLKMGTQLMPLLRFKRQRHWISSRTSQALWHTPMPVPEIVRRPNKCYVILSNRSGNLVVLGRICFSILDSAKRTGPWIGWKDVTRNSMDFVGGSGLIQFSIHFGLSRASKPCSRKWASTDKRRSWHQLSATILADTVFLVFNSQTAASTPRSSHCGYPRAP